MKNILIIDNEEPHRIIFRTQIEAWFPGRCRVFETDNSLNALEIIGHNRIDCIILDYMLNGETGKQIVHQFKRDLPDCPPIIFVTCALTEDLRRDVLALGASECLLKSSLRPGTLANAVAGVVE